MLHIAQSSIGSRPPDSSSGDRIQSGPQLEGNSQHDSQHNLPQDACCEFCCEFLATRGPGGPLEPQRRCPEQRVGSTTCRNRVTILAAWGSGGHRECLPLSAGQADLHNEFRSPFLRASYSSCGPSRSSASSGSPHPVRLPSLPSIYLGKPPHLGRCLRTRHPSHRPGWSRRPRGCHADRDAEAATVVRQLEPLAARARSAARGCRRATLATARSETTPPSAPERDCFVGASGAVLAMTVGHGARRHPRRPWREIASSAPPAPSSQ